MSRSQTALVCLAWLGFAAGFCPTNAVGADEPSGLAAVAAIESALVHAIAEAEKSVVAIARLGQDASAVDFKIDVFGQARQPQPTPDQPDFIPSDYATGVVVDAAGLILTAHHVLRDGSSYWVTTNDRRIYLAKVVATDPRGDLAVLKIEAKNLTPIKLGDASKLRKGQIVIALGNPYAIARDGQVSASWGIVSNLGRKDGPVAAPGGPTNGRPALHQNGSLIQTDAKLNLGTSGGALVNLSGEMVGLTVALSATLGYEQPAGFALPVDAAFKRALGRLKEGREAEYGFLGVQIDNLRLGDHIRGEHGVMVHDVVAGTPAEKADLHAGDVITHVADEPVYDRDDFMVSVGRLPAGDKVKLTWLRAGDPLFGQANGVNPARSKLVELAKYPVPANKVVTTFDPSWRGVRVDFITTVPALQAWVEQRRVDPRGCVLVTEVAEDSPAWQAGLRGEMVISHVANRSIGSPHDFQKAVAALTGPVDLRVILPTGDRVERTIAQAD